MWGRVLIELARTIVVPVLVAAASAVAVKRINRVAEKKKEE